MAKNKHGAASDVRRSTHFHVLAENGNKANLGGSRSSGSHQSAAGLGSHRSFPTSLRHRTAPVTLEGQRELVGVTSNATRRSCPNRRKTPRQVEDGGLLEGGTR